ncbi:MAG TPA: fumarate reductase/succinate dehydrogenase flavoprotein subunit, partial [Acidimicrobiia bacterium]
MTTSPYEHHEYDVLIIGAGGAGLRAAIEAKQRGLRVGIITKSLLGKAHTVMAEGGIAAAMGNVSSEDNWMVHFRDTMRGGKMLNNYRMAELHAKESPDRVRELEQWGALFDRTKDGKILQRDFGGHRYARLAHVGDRTGLELIRTLQQKVVSMGTDVFMECKVLKLVHDDDGKIAGCVAYWRPTGEFVTFSATAVIIATGGVGRSWKFTSNSWEGTGDGHAMALWAGAQLIDMECIQFHPTGMVWPLSVRGLLVTEGVRGDGGVLRNSEGERFMFNYVPDMFRAETAETEEEGDKWYDDHEAGRRPPELLPRDEVARAINAEVKAGRGTPHGGVYLDIATRRSPEFIRRRLPSMYHQFMELAGVDITRESMEIGPTCHYIMGGVQVNGDTEATSVPGLYAAGEAAAGLHGANRLGGNSLSDLVVFGRRAGIAASEYVASGVAAVGFNQAEVDGAIREALAPFEKAEGENPYDIQRDLQEMMQKNVGIIRTASEIDEAIVQLDGFTERLRNIAVKGGRAYNPGWNL